MCTHVWWKTSGVGLAVIILSSSVHHLAGSVQSGGQVDDGLEPGKGWHGRDEVGLLINPSEDEGEEDMEWGWCTLYTAQMMDASPLIWCLAIPSMGRGVLVTLPGMGRLDVCSFAKSWRCKRSEGDLPTRKQLAVCAVAGVNLAHKFLILDVMVFQHLVFESGVCLLLVCPVNQALSLWCLKKYQKEFDTDTGVQDLIIRVCARLADPDNQNLL